MELQKNPKHFWEAIFFYLNRWVYIKKHLYIYIDHMQYAPKARSFVNSLNLKKVSCDLDTKIKIMENLSALTIEFYKIDSVKY